MPGPDAIPSLFPLHTHPLTLVSDPDGLLAEEGLRTELAGRGFSVIEEPDPVRLRQRLEQARPFDREHPLIVVTAGPLNELPYDVWQQGHLVTLSLHTFFPWLAYSAVRALSPAQRWRLSHAAPPARRLGLRASQEYVLRHAFGADPEALKEPARLVAWLDGYHRQADPMPGALAELFLLHLKPAAALGEWPIEELLADRGAFTRFVRGQWQSYLQKEMGQLLGEAAGRYLTAFEADPGLQDAVGLLVRSGTLEPVAVERPERLPRWAQPAVLALGEDRRPRRLAELEAMIGEYAQRPLAAARWEEWQAVARAWAELSALRHDPEARPQAEQTPVADRVAQKLDSAFLEWLRRHYAPLGGQRLPAPHHVHHVPHYMAYRERQCPHEGAALLVLDCLSLEDWLLIGAAWRARHPEWHVEERLVLAQIPTVTEVSRMALTSGLRPADLPPAGRAVNEAQQWAAFWAREGVPEGACAWAHLALERDGLPAEVESSRVRRLCLVDGKLDEMVHNSTLGAGELRASLRLWLEGYGRRLEEVIALLLGRGLAVYLASDHGHVEARGMGQPSEGLLAQSRGKRARVYADRHAAAQVQEGFRKTILWSQDGLLPDDAWVLMPEGRSAFAAFQEPVVTHGGPTLDEVVVPLVTILGTA